MRTINFKVWVVLVVFILLSVIIASVIKDVAITSTLILLISFAKFIGVAFYFMELRKAHIIWKSTLIGFASLFLVFIMVLL